MSGQLLRICLSIALFSALPLVGEQCAFSNADYDSALVNVFQLEPSANHAKNRINIYFEPAWKQETAIQIDLDPNTPRLYIISFREANKTLRDVIEASSCAISFESIRRRMPITVREITGDQPKLKELVREFYSFRPSVPGSEVFTTDADSILILYTTVQASLRVEFITGKRLKDPSWQDLQEWVGKVCEIAKCPSDGTMGR